MISSFYLLCRPAKYCSSVTFSIQSTFLPLSCSVTAMCVIPVFGLAPCQCLTPGGHQSTSPGRISSIGPSQHWVQPRPEVTIKVCPSGCVCHAERAPGSNVTHPAVTREGSGAWMIGSMRTAPVKYSSGPFWDACDPFRLISIVFLLLWCGLSFHSKVMLYRLFG